MHRIKATDILALRKIFADRPSADLSLLRERLDADARRLYDEALPVEWVDGEVLCRLHLAAASVLYPDRPRAMTKLGEELASRSYSTVYKLVMAVPSLPFLIRRAGSLWSSYHEAGVATIEDQRDRSMTLVVREAPEFPSPLGAVVSGTILALGKITRTRNPRVREGGSPQAWRWAIAWGREEAE